MSPGCSWKSVEHLINLINRLKLQTPPLAPDKSHLIPPCSPYSVEDCRKLSQTVPVHGRDNSNRMIKRCDLSSINLRRGVRGEW